MAKWTIASTTGGSGLSVVTGGIDAMTAVSSVLTPNGGLGFTHQAVLTGNVTLAAPIGCAAGSIFLIQLIQDSTGGRTLTLNSFYKGLSQFILDTRANTMCGFWFQVSLAGTSALLLQPAMNGNSIS